LSGQLQTGGKVEKSLPRAFNDLNPDLVTPGVQNILIYFLSATRIKLDTITNDNYISLEIMASLSKTPFSQRAAEHDHPVAKRLFEIAEAKKSNLVVSADLTDSESLLACADCKSAFGFGTLK
jgi:hypothetical protein